jgi:succinate dehydrogenase/fumarate reductase flavoprotein subunit
MPDGVCALSATFLIWSRSSSFVTPALEALLRGTRDTPADRSDETGAQLRSAIVLQERVFIVKLVDETNDSNRVAGAVGFSVRENKVFVYKFKACLLVAGGCVNIVRPRSVGEGTGRAWYPGWNVCSIYSMAAEAGAELTLMENRFVPVRFKCG